MSRNSLAVLVLALTVGGLAAQDKAKQKKDETAFTLENIFPKKSMFGPSARGMAFAHDGKHALWLYKPYAERRHGNDLWLLDVRTGKVERLTSATVMAPFSKAARKVVEERIEKAKKAKVDEKKGFKGKLGDWVGDQDADAEKALRYRGISSFEWSPNADEFLFSAQGDVFRFLLKGRKIERLTHTAARESSVRYLPDGKGYTYMGDGHVLLVQFGSHLRRQLDPQLPAGQRMTGYRLSPDGKKIVLLARKGDGVRTGNRTVNIVDYTKRFMDVRKSSRHVSDDPMPKSHTMTWLYDLEGAADETAEPVLVHEHEVSGPRDILRTPRWSPDSTKVVFSMFEQKSENVLVLQGEFPKDKKEEANKEGEEEDKGKDEDEDEESEKDPKKAGEDDAKEKGPVKNPARVVYRFLHNGGPNTPRSVDPQFTADSRHIVFLSEQTGFQHLHLLDPLYESQRPLTHGSFEVLPVRILEDHKKMLVTATKEGSTRMDAYLVDLEKGDMKRLTPKKGEYSRVAVSPDGKHLLASYTAYGSLRELVRIDVARRRQVAVTDSHPDKAKKLTAMAPEFFAFENRLGHMIHGHLFEPDGFKKGDQRPLLLYVYGGPLGSGRKQVVEGNFNSASYFFAQYMARKHGWVTCTIDPRGMSGYGGVFEKANFEQVGKPQVEDLSDGVRHLLDRGGIDPEKVAIHGWSFGGFQTQMCLYTAPEVFKVGIAGAGPTEWENYNSWYTQGTIGKTGVGTADLKKFSLLPLAKNLKGKLLLVHGMQDSNVLYQDTVRVYRELLKAGKETLVELFLDPTGGHGLGGDVKTVNRYRKYEEFLTRTLGSLERPKKPSSSKSGK